MADATAIDNNHSAPQTATAAALTHWLLTEGRMASSMAALLQEFCHRCLAHGLPLWRAGLAVRLLHPQVRGLSLVWRRDQPEIEEIERPHGSELTPAYRNSPVAGILEDGADGLRYRLDRRPPPYPYPILNEIQTQGATDYVAMPLRFSKGPINVATWTSDQPGGFSAQQLETLYQLLNPLGIVLELLTAQRVTVSLLDTYVGRNAGARILSGDIRRGSGSTIRALLWYCDLRGFTPLSDRLTREETIALLNGYFEIMAEPVQRRGGEILKFIGDAMLAIFPLEDGIPPAALCSQALDAAIDAMDGMRARNEERSAWGDPTLKAGIAIHLGDVMYGNIGAPNRLDFTVIGPAVNLVSRIEGLCRDLGQPMLASAAVAEACGARLHSLGRHPVKGLKAPVEVFGFADLVAAPLPETARVEAVVY